MREFLKPTPELLWEGTWSSGTINVPNSDKYTIFIIQNKISNYSVLAEKHQHKKTILGIGGLGGDPYATFFEALYATNGVSAETWTMDGIQQFQSVGVTNGDYRSKIAVNEIYGVL